jgi:predicted dehydrogenase
VAENWEVEPAHLAARQALKSGKIGTLQSFSLSAILFVDNEGDNRYFETEWRRTPQVRLALANDGRSVRGSLLTPSFKAVIC